MRQLIKLKLKILARLIVKRYQPTIVAVTGSIGKTSAKAAIGRVLRDKFRVRVSPQNYNNEFGLPLSIIGAVSPGHNWLGWVRVCWRAVGLLLFKDPTYPQVLVLEMGVDRPGDLAYLVKIAPPDVALVTNVSHSHIEYFGSLDDIQTEKQTLVEQVNNKGLVILNYDNEATREMASASRARVLTYGLRTGADLQAQDLVFNFTKGNYELAGLHCKLGYNGVTVPLFMDNVMTEGALYAALAATAVGLHFQLNLVDIVGSLRDFVLPPGRMNVLPGIKHTFIIDDTYNSSPEAAAAALDILGRIKIETGAHKYAILGEMLELGVYTETGHRAVGEQVAKSGIDGLIAVGEKARDIIRGATEAGLADDFIFYFDKPQEVGKFLSNRIKAGDIILIKASAAVRLERLVKEIMAEPDRAAQLLVRQEAEWQDR
ncbi:MAG: UDP-N-acetylmuramoyl-tripeptide--D-alanyl-D-alanine ligase [Patescibacteria group bacterium]